MPGGSCIRGHFPAVDSGDFSGVMMRLRGDDGAVFLLLTVHKNVCSFISFFFCANLQLQSVSVENGRKRIALKTIEIVFASIQQTQIASAFKWASKVAPKHQAINPNSGSVSLSSAVD